MFQTNPVNIRNLLKDVESGKVQLPDFQRGWVWDDDRIRGLLASISRQFPIGAVMTMSAGGNINFKTRPVEGVNENATNDPEYFLLDGQQRLTSLYQALLHPGPVNTRDSHKKKLQRWYYIDMLKAMNPYVDREDAIIGVPTNRIVTRNFGREIELNLSNSELEYQAHMMPTERLFDSITWMLGYIGYWQKSDPPHPHHDVTKFFEDFNSSILKSFTDYQLPVINLDKDTPKEAVCTVFEKVNTGGVTLTVFELVTASFAAENFSLRDDWNERQQRLHPTGVLQGIGGEQFLQVITLLATQEGRRQALRSGTAQNQAPGVSCKKEAILNLTLKEYQYWADQVEAAFKEAAKFLRSQFIFRQIDLPYNTQLVPLAALYVELGLELSPANAKVRLEHWYWSGIFGEAYAGNTETQFALDLQEVAEYVRKGVGPRLVNESNFVPERLISLNTRNSAAYKGLYALQMKSGGADWRTATPLSLATWHTENIDIHHIFPVAWCKQQTPNVPSRLYNSVINKTPIDARTNQIIGGRSPSEYLARLQREDISAEALDAVLKSHWLNPPMLLSDGFADCFVARGEAMMELIGNAMGKPLSTGRTVFQNALKQAGIGGFGEEVPVQEPLEEYDDSDDIEFDPVGDLGYDEERAAAD